MESKIKRKNYYLLSEKCKEYQDRYMQKKIKCNICNCEFSYSNTSHHKKSKKHIKNLGLKSNTYL